MMFFAWVIFVIVQIGDVWTTNKVLSQGGREANPIVQKVMDFFGKYWGWAKLAATTAIAAYLHFEGAHGIILIVAGINGLVVLNNWRQIK